jgi:hypothetical protein
MDLHIKDVLKNLVNDSSISQGYQSNRVEQFWNERMPKSIVSRTTKTQVRGSTLHLTIDSAALRNELFNSKVKIINMINDHLGSQLIKEVTFH